MGIYMAGQFSVFPIPIMMGPLKYICFVLVSGRSYDNIKKAEEKNLLRARAKAIDDVESMLSSHRRRELM